MPVSTFSSGHPARQRSQLISRWTSTRERLDADERRRSLSEMQELDGTGLYERADWPLADPLSEEEHQPGIDKLGVQDAIAEMEHEEVIEEAVLRNPAEETFPQLDDSGFVEDESDVSELEESDSEEDEDGEHGHSSASSLPHRPQSAPHEQEARESYQLTQSDELDPPQRGSLPEVSPIRHQHRASDVGYREVIPFTQLQPSTRQVANEEEQGEVNAEHDEVNGQNTQEEDDLNESRDVFTPISFGDSPGLQQGSFQSTPPHVNGNHVPRNDAGNRSSIAKGPMPLHRRTSTRSSWVSTTQIPYNKDRIRYSWQSIQDEEPNRPRIHIIKLFSQTATSSAGFPTGEAFGFSISPGGRRIAAFNSARLYVLQTNALPTGISQDFALKRRPLAVEIIDDENTMAILADDHTVNIYDIGLELRRTRTITLDFPTTCIALAPTGGLLAAAYEGGVEVFSLATNALPTDRRAVRSIRMDRLAFSEDGSTLLGTTTRINVSSTVVTSVPVFPAAANGVPTHEELKEAWCTELLHPENIRNSSHATFLREDRKPCNERVFAWNGLEDTFGILNVGDMQYGNIDFPVVISPPLSTCGGLGAAIHSCPAIDEYGDTVAMIVNDRTIRLYIIPHKADETSTSVEAHSIDHELDEGYGCPFSEVRWVYSSSTLPAPVPNQNGAKGRLIVTSPGGVTEAGISEESVEEVEGGRIILFDFDPQFAGQPGQTFSLALGKSPPSLLEEEQVDVADQVALVRRRTVNQSKGGGLSTRPATLGRAATTYGGKAMRNASPAFANVGPHRGHRANMLSVGSMQSEAARSLPDLTESAEPTEVFEEPYVQGAPRSVASLQRAASNVQRHRFQTLEERTQERVSVEGQGNFLPLPEYTEEPNAPLPSRYRAMAGLDTPAVFNPKKPSVVTANNSSMAGSSSSAPRTAPPDVGENFSAEQAFRAANSRMALVQETVPEEPAESPTTASRTGTPTSISRDERTLDQFTVIPRRGGGTLESSSPVSTTASNSGTRTYNSTATYTSFDPPGRSGTLDSVGPLPRSLARAYSNAISPIGSGPPPSLIGDWRNVSPIVRNGSTASGSQTGSMRNGRPTGPLSSTGAQEEEPWDVISPVTPTRGNSYRHSTSLLNPPGHMPPNRTPGATSAFASTLASPSASSSVVGGRRMPPHMLAFRNAAAANANANANTNTNTNTAASLFPSSQSVDHVPLRQPTAKASAVPHPVTAWHPPAPSSSTAQRRSGSTRGRHSRERSLTGRSAFASTTKAKKLGFFKRNKKHDPYAPTFKENQYEGGSLHDTKSMVTWMTKSDSKCSVM